MSADREPIGQALREPLFVGIHPSTMFGQLAEASFRLSACGWRVDRRFDYRRLDRMLYLTVPHGTTHRVCGPETVAMWSKSVS